MAPALRPDLVIVGGGFAGGGLALAVARAGLEALVLERQHVHRDRVRGEWVAPWGVAEAARLGVLEVLVAAPESSFSGRLIRYDEVHEPAAAEDGAIGLDGLLDGVPGALRLSAPAADYFDDRLAPGITTLAGVDGQESRSWRWELRGLGRSPGGGDVTLTRAVYRARRATRATSSTSAS